MKYTLLLQRLDDRGSDAASTLRLEVERDGRPERIADFAGGSGCVFDGYASKDKAFEVVADRGVFGAALLFTEGKRLVYFESCEAPLRVGGMIELKADQYPYKVMKFSSAPR